MYMLFPLPSVNTKYVAITVLIGMPVRRINPAFTSDEFERLQEEKGERTWTEAILEEFGVDE